MPAKVFHTIVSLTRTKSDERIATPSLNTLQSLCDQITPENRPDGSL